MPRRLCCTLQPLPYQSDPGVLFQRIAAAPGALLLDSAQHSEHLGRYDLQSAWPLEQLSPAAAEPAEAFLARLRKTLAAMGEAHLPDGCELPFAGGLIGWFSYDFGRTLQALPRPMQKPELPPAQLGLYAWALITDHQQKQSFLLFHPQCPADERKRISALFRADTPPAPALP